MKNKVEVKKSALNAETTYDLNLITKEDVALVPLTITKKDEGYEFKYDLKDLETISSDNVKSEMDKYRLLLNALDLYDISTDLKFNLHPDNLFIDISLKAKVAFRDVYARDDVFSESIFVKDYLCLLGSMLQDKYSYQDFIDSGIDLLSKDKVTKPFRSLTTIEDIRNLLIEKYKKARVRYTDQLTLVNKKSYKKLKWYARATTFVMILLVMGTGFLYFFENNFLRTINKGYSAFVAVDYIEAIDTLSKVDINRMDVSTKYVVAVSYVRTDALTDVQKENILSNISLLSNERVLDFWVYLAQNQVEEAVDTAKLLDNDEYLVYAYMKKKDAIEKDASLSGSDREAQLNEVNQQLNTFKTEQEQAQEGNE